VELSVGPAKFGGESDGRGPHQPHPRLALLNQDPAARELLAE